ncbi:MAG: hypothetical protein QNJ37_01870 [Crocosphaera sp.]|nr:hypothetical protein [Crocosphaera sp.]
MQGTLTVHRDAYLAVSSGNVGIGTTAPQGKLDVEGDIRAGNSDLYFTKTDHNHTRVGNANGYAAIENAASHGALMILGRAGTSKGRYVRLWDYLQVNGGMDITGSVGIGTTSPSPGAKLDVRGNLYVGGRASIAGNNYWHRAQSTNDAHYGYFEVRRPTDNRRGCYLGYGQPGKYVDLRLEEGNDLAITGGNVSIGRWNPGYAKLEVWASGSTSCGLRTHTSLGPSGYGYGVHATAYGESGSRVYGLRAYAYGVGSGYRYGVHATAYRHSGDKGTCYAGYFTGDVNINGRLSKGAGSFLIDHPLDPLNKTLRHSFVESPENLCLYRGKIKLDSQGRATVEMPAYFPALTKEDEATVNLTAIGTQPFLLSFQWNQEHTAFTIFGSPDAEAAYLVLADRDDPVIHQLRQPVEQEKGNGNFEKEQLLYPQAYGYPQTMGFDYHQQEATGGN